VQRRDSFGRARLIVTPTSQALYDKNYARGLRSKAKACTAAAVERDGSILPKMCLGDKGAQDKFGCIAGMQLTC